MRPFLILALIAVPLSATAQAGPAGSPAAATPEPGPIVRAVAAPLLARAPERVPAPIAVPDFEGTFGTRDVVGPVEVEPVAMPISPRAVGPRGASPVVATSIRGVGHGVGVAPSRRRIAASAQAARERGVVVGRVLGDEQIAAAGLVPEAAVRVGARQPSPRRSVSLHEQSGRVAAIDVCGAPAELGRDGCPATSGWTIGHSGRGGGVPVATRRVGGRVVVVPPAPTTFDFAVPPPGFERVWKDGRLNPLRGPRTRQGDDQSEAIWTDTVPRRLRRVIIVAPGARGR